MQVSVEVTTPLKRLMTIGIPKERIEEALTSRFQNLARTARVNGFRPGKVPLKVLQQKYGTQVRQEVLGQIVEDSFREAIQQQNLTPVGLPTIDFKSGIENLGQEEFAYTAAFEIYPELTQVELNQIAIEKPIAVVTDSDVDNMIHTLREQRQEWKEVDAVAETGKRITVDLIGKIDGLPFKGSDIKKLSLVLGKSQFAVPDLDEKLIGMRAGDDRDITVDFPAEYANTEVAGKTVHFLAHAYTVAEPQLPEINEDFVSAFGVQDGSVETFRQEIRENLERELKQATKTNVKQQVMDGLLKNNDFEVPSSMIEMEIKRQIGNAKQMMTARGIDMGNFEPSPDLFRAQSERNVKLGLLMNHLIKTNDIQVQAERVHELVQEEAATYENPEQVIAWYYNSENQHLIKQMETIALEEQLIEWILTQVQVIEKAQTFDNLVKKQGLSEAQA